MDHAIGRLVRIRVHQDRVHHAEYRGGGANAQRQRDHCRET